MRLEVLEGSEEPIIYPFNSPKLTVGSGENCDVVISSSGISRKHLLITTEDDKFYVIDQGSTNGSFLNEERLVPGRKVEFTSFFPVRLGENVLISLLSDEEGMDSDFSIPVMKEKTSPSISPPKDHDTTTVINLSTLQKVKTETLVLERNKKREIRRKAAPSKKAPEKAKTKTNYVGWLSLVIFGAAAYYNFYILKPIDDEPIRKVGEIILPENGQDESLEPAAPKRNTDLVDESDVPSKEYLNGLLNNLKCTIEEEIYLCDLIPDLKKGKFGVTQVGLSLHILADGSSYFSEAIAKLGKRKDTDLIQRTAAFIFLMKMPELNVEILKDSRLIISLFKQSEAGEYKVDTVIAIKPSVFNREKHRFTPQNLEQIRRVGAPALEFTKGLYIVR